MMRQSRWLLAAAAFLLTILCAIGGCAPWDGTSNAAPKAVISAYPASGTAPLTVHLSGDASTDDAPLASYRWDFGDSAVDAPSAGACCDHLFARPGTYTVVLTVTDRAGLMSTASQEIVVQNCTPFASCRLSNDAPIPNETVQFDASGSLDLDGEIVDYLWEFGDGSTGRGATVTHVYDEVGTYTVRLTVTDDSGAPATTTHDIYVHLGCSGGGCGGGSVCL